MQSWRGWLTSQYSRNYYIHGFIVPLHNSVIYLVNSLEKLGKSSEGFYIPPTCVTYP